VRLKRGLLLVLTLGSPEALAQNLDEGAETPRSEARTHFDHAVELAARGEFEQALAEFEAAYRVSPNFAVLYNIGQAHIELGQPVPAIAVLEQYLSEGALDISPERAEATRAQIAEQRAQTAELSLDVQPAGASVELDGRFVGHAPLLRPIVLGAGVHSVTARAPGSAPLTRQVTLARGEHQRLGLSLISPQSPALAGPKGAALPATEAKVLSIGPPTPTADAGVKAEPEPSRHAWLGYVLGGIGLAAGGVALGHYFYNRERYRDWQAEHDELSGDPPPDDYRARQIDNNELAASIEQASRVTVGLAVASGVLVAGGISVLVVDAGRHPAEQRAARSPELSLSLGGTW